MTKQYFFNPLTGQFFVQGQGFVAPLGNTGNSVELTDYSYAAGVRATYENVISCTEPSFYRGCIICRPVSDGKSSRLVGKLRFFIPQDKCAGGQTAPGEAYCPGNDTVTACREGVDFYIRNGWVK